MARNYSTNAVVSVELLHHELQMEWMTAFLLFIAIIIFLYVVHVPLPNDISDRKKLIFFEFALRIFNEYLANVIELFFGPEGRNAVLRVVAFVAFNVPRNTPDFLTIKWDKFGGVPVRVYTPKRRQTRAALIFIHGGGWSTMKAAYYDEAMYPLVHRLGISIFSVEYRLAPEHPYPAPVDDCTSVTKALLNEKCLEYDVDPEKVILVGDSAGGNLAAVVSLRLRDSSTPMLKGQVLVYPVVHMFGFRSPSYTAYYSHYNGAALLNPLSMARWNLFYIGEKGTRDQVRALLANKHINEKLLNLPEFAQNIPAEHLNLGDNDFLPEQPNQELCSAFLRKATNPEICPIFAKTLAGLPDTMILTAGYDILRDEGILFAKRLKCEGVPTTWKHYPTGYHGVFSMPFSPVKNQMLLDMIDFLSPLI